MPQNDPIDALREAVRLSPSNQPLRRHLVDTLVGSGRYDEAETELKELISKNSSDNGLKLKLADVFARQGKNSAALVIVEEQLKQTPPSPQALVLHAKLLVRAGEIERAVRQYKRAVDDDPSVADSELAERLGIIAGDAAAPPLSPDAEVVDGKLRASDEPPAGDRDVPIERPKTNFSAVGGMDALKEEIRMKVIHPITHAELYKAYGKTVGGGILMYGPPGCGKTHLARATAGEIEANFLSIGINDVLDMWIGSSERNLHAIFEQARRTKPCVLFFDEVDALAASRADMRASSGRHMINQFLAEMDGVNSNNEGVVILAATNAPWHVDAAFRRPGRFDRILFVPPPDAPARASILRIHLKAKPVADIDHEHVAKKTDGFSGADLKAVVDVAVEATLREAMKAGGLKPLTTKALVAAAASLKPSTKEWFATARNYALYSNQGGTYDDILKYLK